MGGINGHIQRLPAENKVLLVDQKIDEFLVVLHGKAHAVPFGHHIRLAPLRHIPVHIAHGPLLPRVKGQQPEILLVGLVVRPVGRSLQVHRVHGIPGALEPFVLPGEYAPACAARLHDVLIAVNEGLALFLLRHVALVAVRVPVLLGHAPAGGNAEFGNHHRHGVVAGEHAQISLVGVHLSVAHVVGGGILDAEHAPVIHIAQIVGIVGVDMVGGKLPRQKIFRTPDVLHVHLGALHEKVGHTLRIEEGVRGGPVGKSHQALLLVALGLVLDDLVAHLGEHHLKGGGVLGGVEILSLVRGVVLHALVFPVRVDNGDILPLHAQNVADDPLGDIPPVGAGAGAGHLTQGDLLVAVDHIHHGPAVVQEGIKKIIVIRIPMGILDVIVDPDAMDEPQRLLPILVIFVESLVEIVRLHGVNAQCVGAQLLYLGKPAQVGLLVHGKVRGPLPRLTGTHIDAFDRKDLISAVRQAVNLPALRAHEGGDRLLRMQVNIPAQAVVGVIISDVERHQGSDQNDKLFHWTISCQFAFSLNFFTFDSAAYCRRVSMFSSIQDRRAA